MGAFGKFFDKLKYPTGKPVGYFLYAFWIVPLIAPSPKFSIFTSGHAFLFAYQNRPKARPWGDCCKFILPQNPYAPVHPFPAAGGWFSLLL